MLEGPVFDSRQEQEISSSKKGPDRFWRGGGPRASYFPLPCHEADHSTPHSTGFYEWEDLYLFSPCTRMACVGTTVPSTAHWTVFKAKFCCMIFLTVISQNSNYPIQNINSQIKLGCTSFVGSMYCQNRQATAYEVSSKLYWNTKEQSWKAA